MSKIRDPIRFSDYFGVDERKLSKLGVLNPNLNVDTKLFIDPLLLATSRHAEIKTAGRRTYDKHFEMVIKFLARTGMRVTWHGERLSGS